MRRNLALLQAAGAELVHFSPLADAALPDGLAGLYFGGGCPEALAEELANNRPMVAAVAAFARKDGVVYAEYAGLIYLSQSVQPVGALPVSMGAGPAPVPGSPLLDVHCKSAACACVPSFLSLLVIPL